MTAAPFGVTPAGQLAVAFAWPMSSGGWSLHWMMRFGLLALLFAIVGVSRLLLGNRRRYGKILESTPLATLDVVAYNACCYLSVGITADPTVIPAPAILETPAVAHELRVVGSVLLCLGAGLLLATLLRRKVIGGQNTRQGLLTSGTYRVARHPIYLGIVLASLSVALITSNFDGMMVFPLVFLANFLQAAIEEKYDVGERFKQEYQAYRERTWMFGPPWFWLALAGALAFLSTLGLLP